MAKSPAHFAVVLLLGATVSAQRVEYCKSFGTNSIDWNVNQNPNLEIYTRVQGTSSYGPNVNCDFSIRADIPGRIIVQVLDTSLFAYSASISIRTDPLSGYLTSWDQITYDRDRDQSFIGLTNRLFINFRSRSSPITLSAGVRLLLTFMRADGCPPSWTPIRLDGYSQCLGFPTTATYKFGTAQRYCNLHRSNLLISQHDSVYSALQRVNAANVWIGMTAEPSGPYTSYRWINNFRVSSNQSVSCTGSCRPGSTTHRCVYARDPRTLVQIECGKSMRPLCYMPAGGTDIFYAGSSAQRASGALLASAVLLFWGLQH